MDFASSFVFNLSFLRESARILGNLTLSLPLSPTTSFLVYRDRIY
nr:MAG TPA: hypothetical protein [Caudoviricetes sp.]